MRLVLDTNVLVSAIGWEEGPPREILVSLRENKHSLIISPDLLNELTRALRYPKLHRAITHPSLPSVLAWLHEPEHLVPPQERIHAIASEPDDNLVLEAAVAGKADVIVSGDRHLLGMGSFRGIPILSARAFVAKYL